MEKLTTFMKNSGVVFSHVERQEGQESAPGRGKCSKTKNKGKLKGGKTISSRKSVTEDSETTIYDNAVEQLNSSKESNEGIKEAKRISTSSEELGNSSDELRDTLVNFNDHNLFLDQARRQCEQGHVEGNQDRYYTEQPRPGTSGQQSGNYRENKGQNHRESDRDKAERCATETIQDAEASKIRVLDPTGESGRFLANAVGNRIQSNWENGSRNVNSRRYVSDDGYESDQEENWHDNRGSNENFNQPNLGNNPALIDENYLVVGNYIEGHIHQRIEEGGYVDFANLLPRDRMILDENRMEIMNKNGKTFFVPANDLDNTGITNFSQWEQAFRVFSNINTQKYPGWASELIQYNHIIHTAALSFTWENVYLYDRDFRMHISRFPNKSWAVILQQAWTMRLKDRNSRDQGKGGACIKG